MKASNIIYAILTSLCIVSCAHKSGHNRPQAASHSENTGMRDTQTSNVTRGGQRNLEVTVSNSRGDKNKLDGSKIFAKYNTAVFMVFTSDGYNGYQGSGFFINPDGLAVSNYHVFQGTNIGAEQIKLANSDEAYKVAEVIHSNEEEDFILFSISVH